MKKLFLVSIVITMLFLSCGKDNSPAPPTNSNDTTSKQNTLPPPGVYIAGDSIGWGSLMYPVYWVNGKEVHLSDNLINASGNGIAVSDSDVYVSCDGVALGNKTTYWKNTTPISLPDTSIVYPGSTGITLSGKDVYTVGEAYINDLSKKIPVYWKNQDKPVKIATFFF